MKTILTLIASTLLASSLLQAADNPVPKDYPLKTCPVSKEELGSEDMVPVKVTHDGTDVWLCCKNCKKKFDKDPAKYVKPVKEALSKK